MQFQASRTMPRDIFRMHEMLRVAALDGTKVGEELFVDHVESFLFQNVNSTPFFEKME